jgi:hypothetical protein
MGPIFNVQAVEVESETPVYHCQSTLCNIPEELRCHLHRTGSLQYHCRLVLQTFYYGDWRLLAMWAVSCVSYILTEP